MKLLLSYKLHYLCFLKLKVLFVSLWILIISFHFQAEQEIMASKLDKEYAGIAGIPEFTKAAAELAFGADSPVTTGGLVGIQLLCLVLQFPHHLQVKSEI